VCKGPCGACAYGWWGEGEGGAHEERFLVVVIRSSEEAALPSHQQRTHNTPAPPRQGNPSQKHEHVVRDLHAPACACVSVHCGGFVRGVGQTRETAATAARDDDGPPWEGLSLACEVTFGEWAMTESS